MSMRLTANLLNSEFEYFFLSLKIPYTYTWQSGTS